MTEWIITSSVLIVVVVLLRQLLKGKISLRLQYALWAIVLVRLLVPITFGESEISVLNVLDQAASVVVQQEPVEEPTVSDPGWEPIGGTANPLPSGTVTTPRVPPDPYPVISELPEPEPDEPSGAPTVSVAQILTPFWLCGIAVVGLWFLFTNLRFWLRLRRSRRVLALDCPIRVYVTGAAETPCLFGLIRPAVYLTPEVAEDEVALRHVLAHELTHYRHWDHVWSVLRCVCLAVHWYNPLVWLAASLSRRDAELACDESTIRRIGEEERTAYGRTLIGLTCVHRSNLLHTATTMTGSKKSIKERIVLIAKKPKMAIYALVAVILIAAIAVGCTFTGAKEKEWDTVQFTCEGVEGYLEGKVTLTQGSRLDVMIQNKTDEYFQIDKFWDLYQKGEDGQWTAIKVNPTAEQADQPTESLIMPEKEEGTSWNVFYVFLDGEELPEGAYRVKTSAWWLIDPAGDTWRDWTKGEEFFLIIEFTVTKDGEVKLNGDADLTEPMHIPDELLPSGIDDNIPGAVLDCAEQVLADQLAEHIQENGKGDRTELVSLKQHETGTAGLNDAVFVYRITYNLHWENAFEYYQHYMALGYNSFTDEYTLLDDFSADELITRYGTEELLAKYDGDIFVAAAMELYREWLEEHSEPADPNAELLTYFQNLLTFDGGETWYNGALTCAYDDPRHMDIGYVFYVPFNFLENVGWEDFTAEEEAYLISQGFRRELSAQKRHGTQLNTALQQYFGISLSEVRTPDGWVYYEGTDSYYSNTNDIHVMENFTVTKVEQGEDGLVYVYYTAVGPIFRQDGTSLDGWEHDMVLTLRAKVSNVISPHGYVVVANQSIEEEHPPEGLSGEIVTSATYPSDPEEYYLVAKLPGESIWLYARNHGEKTLLVYGDNVRREYDHRAHTSHLNLPRPTMLDGNCLAVVSEVNTGTQVGVDQLIVYDLDDLSSYVYDWSAIAEEFNRSNTLIYNKEMNSFTLEYNGRTYITGTLNIDMSTYLDLEDGFTGALIASGQIVRCQVNEDGTITVTMQTCVGRGSQGGFDAEGFWSYSDYYPMSVGVTGIELSWNLSFDQGQLWVDSNSIRCSGVYEVVTGAYSIQDVVNNILVGGLMYDDTWQSMGSFTLTSTAADGRVDTYVSSPRRFSSLDSTPGHSLRTYFKWTQVDEAQWTGMAESAYSLRFANDWYAVTVYTNENKMKLEVNGVPQYFVGTPNYDARGEFSEVFYQFRDCAKDALRDYEYAVCQVSGSETDYDLIARELAEQYAQIILDRPGWADGQALDVRVRSAEVFDAYYGAENPNFCFEKQLYIKVTEEQRNVWETGSGLADPFTEGPYAGYYVHGMEVDVRKKEDGNWHMTGMGTGGASVALPIPLDNATTQQLMELYFLTEGHTHDWRILYCLAEKPLGEVAAQFYELGMVQYQELANALLKFAADYPEYALWSAGEFEACIKSCVSSSSVGLTVKADGAKAAAEEFARVYGEALMDTYDFITDYKYTHLEVREVSKDVDALVGMFRYYVLPAGGSDAYLAEEIFTKTEDGWVYSNPAPVFLLERVGDGLWQCTAYGAYSGFTLSEFGYENGLVGAIMGNTELYRCEGDDPYEAALKLITAYVEDLMVPDDLRSFTITQYRNLTVEIEPTLEMSDAAISQYIYNLSTEEIGENTWILEFGMEYRWDGVLHDPPCGPSTGVPDDYWETVVHQGSPRGFLLTRNGNEFTLQSRY